GALGMHQGRRGHVHREVLPDLVDPALEAVGEVRHVAGLGVGAEGAGERVSLGRMVADLPPATGERTGAAAVSGYRRSLGKGTPQVGHVNHPPGERGYRGFRVRGWRDVLDAGADAEPTVRAPTADHIDRSRRRTDRRLVL